VATYSNANALIGCNGGRLGKNLWTADDDGELITLYNAYNETDEARFIVESILDYISDKGGRRRDCAILYRSNAQSRVIEEYLVAAGVKYRVYGGLRYFERAEIKDTLAYMRLVSHHFDDVSFERIINQPARGIGDKTVGQIRAYARDANCSMWEAAQALVANKGLTARAAAAVKKFIDMIESMTTTISDQSLPEQVNTVSEVSGLIAHFKKDQSERGQSRVENVEELSNAARTFAVNFTDDPEAIVLDEFLTRLRAWNFRWFILPEWSRVCFRINVQLKTLPSSKKSDACVTSRAEKKLYLTMAEQRRLYGRDQYNPPSKFIGELPTELLEEIRPRMNVSLPVYQPSDSPRFQEENDTGIEIGQMVTHGKFGVGVVLDQEGRGQQARVQVNFEDAGNKWLVVAYANLQPA